MPHAPSRTSLVALFACVAACSDPGYRVSLTFDGGVDPASVQFIDLLVLPECPLPESVASGEPPADDGIAHLGLSRSEADALPAVGTLPMGTYGLYARGFDASCNAVVAGCSTVTLERGGEGTLSVALAATALVGACDASDTCIDGQCVPPAEVRTCTLTPSADGSVRRGLSGPASSGVAATMATSETSGIGHHFSYVAFDVGGTCLEGGSIPSGAAVVSAALTLRLETDCNCSTDAHRLDRVESAWTEADLTAEVEPPAGGTSVSFSAPAQAGSDVVISDAALTADVGAFVDGTLANHGWRIRQAATSGGNDAAPYVWSTREGTAPPELEIRWVAP